jgi:hypothetical protein
MSSSTAEVDEQIERLRKGDTLAENEVKALCDKVSEYFAWLINFRDLSRFGWI